MLLKLIDDINRALDNDIYFAALSLALTLPDICGKAEHPDIKSNKERYVKWYDTYVGKYEMPCEPNENGVAMPRLNGAVIYSLRNSMLHQGTPNVDEGKVGIDKFVLVVERPKDFEIYIDVSCVKWPNNDMSRAQKEYRVHIRKLCYSIADAAQRFYLDNKDKFNFFNYTIIDMDEETQKLRRLGILDLIAEQIEEDML